jgi:cytochrome oxidase assembly protein ShyY1
MKFVKLKSKGQTFVEFLLVFVVLSAATAGVWTLYKSAWKKRYIDTSDVSAAILPTGAKGTIAKAEAEFGGYSGYVK